MSNTEKLKLNFHVNAAEVRSRTLLISNSLRLNRQIIVLNNWRFAITMLNYANKNKNKTKHHSNQISFIYFCVALTQTDWFPIICGFARAIFHIYILNPIFCFSWNNNIKLDESTTDEVWMREKNKQQQMHTHTHTNHFKANVYTINR